MAITFPAMRANSDKRPNLDQFPSVVLVPAVIGDPDWALNLMTIAVDGDIGGNPVVQGAYAERYVPGLVQGHLYKMTISFVNSGPVDVDIKCSGQTILTMEFGQSKTLAEYEFIATDGNKFKIDHALSGNYTGAVKYLKIEAMDPLNVDLIPDA